MGNLPYIQKSNCVPEIHILRNTWQKVAVLPNHESELPNLTKWAKMELIAIMVNAIPLTEFNTEKKFSP